MSLWTDVRDNIENQVGIGPDSNTAVTLSSAVIGGGRAVGDLIKAPAGSPAPAPSATAPITQKVQAFVGGNSKTLLIAAAVGLGALFFVFRRRR